MYEFIYKIDLIRKGIKLKMSVSELDKCLYSCCFVEDSRDNLSYIYCRQMCHVEENFRQIEKCLKDKEKSKEDCAKEVKLHKKSFVPFFFRHKK